MLLGDVVHAADEEELHNALAARAPEVECGDDVLVVGVGRCVQVGDDCWGRGGEGGGGNMNNSRETEKGRGGSKRVSDNSKTELERSKPNPPPADGTAAAAATRRARTNFFPFWCG